VSRTARIRPRADRFGVRSDGFLMTKKSASPIRRKCVALIAHDNMKPTLLEWVKFNAGTLSYVDLVATGTTGRLVEETLGRPVTKFLSGPLGGDQQIGAQIAMRGIDVVFFFPDPLEPQPHDPDVRALLRLANVWNVPIATNLATADYLISSPLFQRDYVPVLPDYSDHNSRSTL
jgi:methylglyoxal synthase